jgi:hypothetical protein
MLSPADLTDKERAALITAANLAIEAIDNNQEQKPPPGPHGW